ncbi:hypothetical protein EV182_000069 [Spiromyces aspiralis]|uniref:Uncharacterized protein n=1 Tax=Spiromyces aspiralis TaxID=68401 RepID=A0ACC1HV11_9FUNG|nr:hypothetical protein EV182_000069 [Spiromyces aspiralis]
MLRLRRKGWNKADFERTAESCYDLMNEAFAKGDKQTLETICMSGMYSKLKNEIKNRKGRFEWKKTRTLAPPTIVQARIGKLGKDMSLGQLVVKIEQEQAVAVYNKANQLAAGDISKPVRVKEYIVFQCMVTDPNSRWMIYGKLNEGK